MVGAHGPPELPNRFLFASIVDDGRRLQGTYISSSSGGSKGGIVLGFKYSSRHQGIFEGYENISGTSEKKFMPIL